MFSSSALAQSASVLPIIWPDIDRLPGYKNLIIATGHGMLGMTQAPITGKLISQLACGQTPEINLKPHGLTRFR